MNIEMVEYLQILSKEFQLYCILSNIDGSIVKYCQFSLFWNQEVEATIPQRCRVHLNLGKRNVSKIEKLVLT
jgi:hypothetical protein